MKRSPMRRRTPLKAKKGLAPISAKRRAYSASAEGVAGKEHMALVAQMRCVICGARPVEVHHVICGRYSTRRAENTATIPLCPPHHRIGPDAIHNGKASWVARYGKDTDYLPAVRMEAARLLAAQK